MTAVLDKRIEVVGGYVTLRQASEDLGCTRNALYLWMKRNDVPCKFLGSTILVQQKDIVGYVPRGK